MFAATPPDPGSLSFVTFPALVISFGWAGAFVLREPKEKVQWKGFLGTLLGVGVGLVIYGFGLLSGLY